MLVPNRVYVYLRSDKISSALRLLNEWSRRFKTCLFEFIQVVFRDAFLMEIITNHLQRINDNISVQSSVNHKMDKFIIIANNK